MTQGWNEPEIPASIGKRADLYNDVRSLRLAMEKEVAPIKSFETKLRESIIEDLSKSEDTGAAGLRYRAQIVTKVVPKIEADGGWQKLYDYIQRNGRFDLLQKRLGEKAVDEMWQNGEAVPGVEKMLVPDVSITKI